MIETITKYVRIPIKALKDLLVSISPDFGLLVLVIVSLISAFFLLKVMRIEITFRNLKDTWKALTITSVLILFTMLLA